MHIALEPIAVFKKFCFFLMQGSMVEVSTGDVNKLHFTHAHIDMNPFSCLLFSGTVCEWPTPGAKNEDKKHC